MSTDLKLQFPSIQIKIPPPISIRSSDCELDRRQALLDTGISSENTSSDSDEQNELCRTPRSEKNKIPQLRSPPPAPRKKIRPPACKRKLRMELNQFFEIVNRGEELEELFRSGFEFASRLAKRNKCVVR